MAGVTQEREWQTMLFQARRFAQVSQRADAIARAEVLLRQIDDAATFQAVASDSQTEPNDTIGARQAFRAVVAAELARWREEHRALQQRLAETRTAAMREVFETRGEPG